MQACQIVGKDLQKKIMKITQELLDDLTEQAKASERLRMHLDLRDSAEYGSQRMLNAIEPGSILPIHRHQKTSETMVCLRGNLGWNIMTNRTVNILSRLYWSRTV